MRNANHSSRLIAAGMACSAICAGAGVVAFSGGAALRVSSVMLVLAALVAVVGYAYADNRRLGWGMLALSAAALPLFFPLYFVGEYVFHKLGASFAGGVLIALAVAVALGSIALARSNPRLGGDAEGSTRRLG